MPRLTLNYRLQAALHYEAADFLRTARANFREVGEFINGLPPAARLEFDEIVGGIDPGSTRYHGTWFKENRNRIFHYSEINQRKAVGKALRAAAEKSGSISYQMSWGASGSGSLMRSRSSGFRTRLKTRVGWRRSKRLCSQQCASRSAMNVYLSKRGVL